MASRGGFLVGDGALRRKNTTRKQNVVASKHIKPMTRRKKKPEWDSTVNDLNVLKATQQELRQRHESHKSKNVGFPFKSSPDKENESFLMNTPDTAVKRKQAILQEILYGQDQFHDVLAETDKTMSAVKDLFGDDPKKFLGFPNVTVAPNRADETSASLMIGMTGRFANVLETPTHLSTLSDSIMRTPALNEVSDESEMSDSSPETAAPAAAAFQPRLDLQRYRQFISHESANEKQLDMIPERLQPADVKPTEILQEDRPGNGHCHLGENTVPGQTQNLQDKISSFQSSNTVNVPGQTQALPTMTNKISSNDKQIERPPEKVNIPKKSKAKGKLKPVDTSTSSSNSGLRSLDDLKKMVESLEDEIAEYEMETGRQPTATTLQTSSFSGYTSSLITAVAKLMKYLKETETQRKAEAVLRDQILQGFAEQRTLIDALTNDIVQTQEQNVGLQSEFVVYRQHTDRQLVYLQRELQTVLKSFEYYTVQTTIDTLNSTQPVPLPQLHNNDQHMGRHTRGEYIPVSTIDDEPYHGNTDPPDGIVHYPAVSTQGNGALPPYTESSFNQANFNGNIKPNTHIHINQPYLHHNTDNFTVREPTQKHFTVPGSADLGIQQSNVPSSTVSSSVNSGLNSHLSQAYPGYQGDFTSTGQIYDQEITSNQERRQDYIIKGQISNQDISNVNLPSVNMVQNGNSLTNSTMQQQHHYLKDQDEFDINLPFSNVLHNEHTNRSTEFQQPYPTFQNSNDKNPNPPFNSIANRHPMDNPEANYMPISSHSSVLTSGAPIPSHNHLQGGYDNEVSAPTYGTLEGQLLSGVQYVSDDCREDSLLMRSLIKDPQGTKQLRNRLQGIAMKQKNSAALKTNTQNRTGKTSKGHPSPHVHFKLPEAPNTQGLRRELISGFPEQSPSVSPIPEDGPSVQPVGPRKGRQVVVNLPSVWSDVSSTVSL